MMPSDCWQHGEEAAPPHGEDRLIPIERLVSLRPFMVRRRIAFRDCDPAGIVYTPRFVDPIASSAFDLFMIHVRGPERTPDAGLENVGYPAKAVNFVFERGTPLDSLIDMSVSCERIGNTSFTLNLKATNEAAEPLFSGSITNLCIDRSAFKRIPVPEVLRKRLATYQIKGQN